MEHVLQDLTATGGITYVSLRYFNVDGADRDERIGEGKEDGTCIRDYLHVEDLAAAYVGLGYLLDGGESEVFKCGYEKGYFVLEVITAAQKVISVYFPVGYEGRRSGTPLILVAGARKICERLGWVPACDNLERIIIPPGNGSGKGRSYLLTVRLARKNSFLNGKTGRKIKFNVEHIFYISYKKLGWSGLQRFIACRCDYCTLR